MIQLAGEHPHARGDRGRPKMVTAGRVRHDSYALHSMHAPRSLAEVLLGQQHATHDRYDAPQRRQELHVHAQAQDRHVALVDSGILREAGCGSVKGESCCDPWACAERDSRARFRP